MSKPPKYKLSLKVESDFPRLAVKKIKNKNTTNTAMMAMMGKCFFDILASLIISA